MTETSGVIKIFTEDEKEELLGQKMMFSFLDPDLAKEGYIKAGTIKGRGMVPQAERKSAIHQPGTGALNPLQEQAVTHTSGPLLIVAGPGADKTYPDPADRPSGSGKTGQAGTYSGHNVHVPGRR